MNGGRQILSERAKVNIFMVVRVGGRTRRGGHSVMVWLTGAAPPWGAVVERGTVK